MFDDEFLAAGIIKKANEPMLMFGEFDLYGVLAAGTPVKANIDGEWLVGKKLETPKRLEMLDSFSDNKTILVEINGK